MRAFGRVAFLLAAGAAVVRAQGEEDQFEEDDVEQDALSTEQMRGMHGKIDSNRDGKISMEEIMRFSHDMRKAVASKDISTVLDEMDTDKDGKLSLEELLKDMEQWGESEEESKEEKEARVLVEKEKFSVADRDRNGVLDQGELPALFYPEVDDAVLEITAKEALKQKDRDHDGKLSNKEFWEGDVVDGEDLEITEEERADFTKLDKNGDGFLDLSELKVWESGKFHTEEAMKSMFEIADKDHDLHLSADELEAARAQIAGTDAQYHLMEWAEHHEL